MARVLRWLIWIAGAVIGAKVLLSLGIQVWPVPTPLWARQLLDHRWRRRYRDPPDTMRLLGLAPGMRVLEIGPGSGLFTAEAAQLVKAHGQLICVDLQVGMLRPLQQQLQAAGPGNVLLAGATAEHLPLPDASIDLAFAIAVLPMIRDKRQALRELRRVLKPDGILAVSEEVLEPEYVPAFVIRRWCQQAGFSLITQIHRGWWYLLQFTNRNDQPFTAPADSPCTTKRCAR
jgi:ubiquinone/menaquinone biosynthesis C-methylase UbiE